LWRTSACCAARDADSDIIGAWASLPRDYRHPIFFRPRQPTNLHHRQIRSHRHRQIRCHLRLPNTPSRHILPNDLANAVKHLGDKELDRLLSAVLAEQKRRGKKLSVSHEGSPKRRVDAVVARLAQGKLNAVRAAFKAGVTPSRIARQFGISQSDVRKALASDEEY
jgi:hypothetical protein